MPHIHKKMWPLFWENPIILQMYFIHSALSLRRDKHNWKQFFRGDLTFQNMSPHYEDQRCQCVPAPPVWILGIQISESLLLILKEALNVIHNEIKRGRSIPPPPFKPSVPPFSPDYMDVLRGGRERARKEQWRKSQRMRWGQEKRKT